MKRVAEILVHVAQLKATRQSIAAKESHESQLKQIYRRYTVRRLIVSTLDPCYHLGSYFMLATKRFLRASLRG